MSESEGWVFVWGWGGLGVGVVDWGLLDGYSVCIGRMVCEVRAVQREILSEREKQKSEGESVCVRERERARE